ncbi:Hypothetical protein PHPALM_36731 [Phytophthora palmivora]|uniref:Uncharacterized protein n=1 Tax=Phytophthora palmivora TaxID=4796 RepID=A0A2P4WZ66_9STRA|nr:Hypothetical protein PHPALM_36731 [Phytophthora palmivora]
MGGLRQQSKSSAHDERGYGSVNLGTVYHTVAKKPRTTYALAVVDPRSQQPSGSQPGVGLPARTSPVTRDNLATSQAAGASLSAVSPGRLAPHGSGALRSDQGGVPTREGRRCPNTRLILRDRVYAIEIAPGLGGQAGAQAGKPGTLEVFRQNVGALGSETQELHRRIDRRFPASTVKKLYGVGFQP